jgi:hypothetical protein
MLNLLVGLPPASTGHLRVVGESPSSGPGFLARVGFVAQDCPLYGDFTVADLLRFGRSMNPTWDDEDRGHDAASPRPVGRGYTSAGCAGIGLWAPVTAWRFVIRRRSSR